jgi:hypothetical protein
MSVGLVGHSGEEVWAQTAKEMPITYRECSNRDDIT